MNELHFDSGEILKHRKTPEGYLQCFIVAARTGDLEYEDPKGHRRIEFIEERDLFNPKSYNTLKGKPIPVEHPGRMDSTNTVGLLKGAVMNTIVQVPKVYDHSFLGVFATIYDQETIERIERGELRQVSCSYDCDTILQPDGRYRQVDRRYNHLALTTDGRAGSAVAIHMDSRRTPTYWTQRNDSMPKEKVKIKGKTFEVDPELYNALRDFMDDLKEEMGTPADGGADEPMEEEEDFREDEDDDIQALEQENQELRAQIEELQDSLDEALAMLDEAGNQVERADSMANAGLSDKMQELQDALDEALDMLAESDTQGENSEELLAKIEELQDALNEALEMLDQAGDELERTDSICNLLNTWEKARPILMPALQAGTLRVDGISCSKDGELEFDDSVRADSIKRAAIEAKGIRLSNNDSKHVDLAFDLLEVTQDPTLTVDRLVRQDSKAGAGSARARERRMMEQLEISRKPLDLDRRR